MGGGGRGRGRAGAAKIGHVLRARRLHARCACMAGRSQRGAAVRSAPTPARSPSVRKSASPQFLKSASPHPCPSRRPSASPHPCSSASPQVRVPVRLVPQRVVEVRPRARALGRRLLAPGILRLIRSVPRKCATRVRVRVWSASVSAAAADV